MKRVAVLAATVVGLVGVHAQLALAGGGRTHVCPSGSAAVLNPKVTVSGTTATATFSIHAYCSNIRVSLATYQPPTSAYGYPMAYTDSSTSTFSSGGYYGWSNSNTYTVTAKVSSCYYHAVLVFASPVKSTIGSDLYSTTTLGLVNGGRSCAPLVPLGPTCPSGTNAILNPTLTAVQGGTATGTFSIAAGCSNISVSLASYDAPSADFALPQTLIDSKTGSFSTGGPYSFTVNVSACFYQVDLVQGDVIAELTPTNLYNDRKLQWANGGSACPPPDTTPPTCRLTATVSGPPKSIQVTVQDSGSGIQSIVASTYNANAPVSFTPGTTSPIVVTATKVDQTKGSTLTLTVTDMAGNRTVCDPVIPAVPTSYSKHSHRGGSSPAPQLSGWRREAT